MGWKTLDDMELEGKTVLTRVDINVPMEDGKVTDDTRIRRLVPTISDLLAKGAKPVLLAHFGRPKGQVVPEMSLQPLVPALKAAFGASVVFVADCRGPAAEAAASALQPGRSCCWKTPAFTPAKKRTTPTSRWKWQSSAISTAMMRSPPPTAPMPRPRRWRVCCPLVRAA